MTERKPPGTSWESWVEFVIIPILDKYDNGITRISRALGRVGIVRATFDERSS